jgi:UTP-glucose-1-phosphate uridylyltransferase
MSEQIELQNHSSLDPVKPGGGQRLTRIQAIIKTAATEVFGEVKAGATEVKTLATENLAPHLWHRTQQAWQNLQQRYQQVQHQQVAMESQLETKIGQWGTVVASKEQQLKHQIKQLLEKTMKKS